MLLPHKTIGFTMQKHRYYFCVRIFRNIKNLSQSRKDRKGHAEKRIKASWRNLCVLGALARKRNLAREAWGKVSGVPPV